MIGIVVVSHSHALATAAVRLAAEMVEEADRPQIEVAAGLDETTFGTDAAAVAEAIGRADSGEGVVVLLDLGSAVLSAEMALEFVDPDLADRVVVSSAPLIEGLVAAAVTAATGGDLALVAAEAGRGLAAKVDHLGPAAGGSPAEAGAGIPEGTDADPLPEDAVRARVEVTAPHGLHARPAARFVQCVNLFTDARVQVSNPDSGRGPVDGRSLTAIATLDARQGHRLDLAATGESAQDAIDALVTLAESGFGDQPDRVAPPTPAPAGSGDQPFSGLRAAVGRVRRADGAVDLSRYAVGDVERERQRLDVALSRAREDLTALAGRTAEQVGQAEGAVFEAHLGLLADPALLDPVHAAIESGSGAPEAWKQRVEDLRAAFAALPDAYQRERAQDVTSVGNRVLRALAGQAGPDGTQGPAGEGERPAVLVVDELDPATAVTLDPATVVGVVTVGGGATGHGVLVARARGVPLLTGAASAGTVTEGTVVAFDEVAGRLEIDPDAATLAEFADLIRDRERNRDRLRTRAHEPATTADGRVISVKANVASVAEAAQAATAGAEGSGLVRTEVLFGDRAQPPSVAEQVAVFEAIADALPGRSITIRTWDVGGDKPLPFHPQPQEANPFLGVRGIRSFRTDPNLLVDQLEALCRVARHYPVRVMFPMVTTVEEVDWALARIDEASQRLADGRPDGLQVGIMVEVPAAALRAEALTTMLDFVSIGSNDLTQYTLAAERGSPFLDAIADAADPAVLRLVRETCVEVADGVDVCVCGDAAGDPDLALLLVGLGVRELSATTASVPAVKDVLRRHSLTDLEDLADRALHADSAADVRELVRAFRAAETAG